MTVAFYFDFRSPYAYLAQSQVAVLGSGVDYRLVDILDVMKTVNNQPSMMCAAKMRYSGMDAARSARQLGIAFTPNGGLLGAMGSGQFDGALLSRAGLAAQELGVFDQAIAALFKLVWASADNVLTEEGRTAFAAAHGLPAELWQLAADDRIGAILAGRNADAVERGVFGVPTLFVGNEMFFGHDRLQLVQARLQASIIADAAA